MNTNIEYLVRVPGDGDSKEYEITAPSVATAKAICDANEPALDTEVELHTPVNGGYQFVSVRCVGHWYDN